MVRQTVRYTLATLTIVAACTAAATPSTSLRASVRGADPDLSALQQRVDRLEALTSASKPSRQSSASSTPTATTQSWVCGTTSRTSSPTPASVTTRRARSIAKAFARSS